MSDDQDREDDAPETPNAMPNGFDDEGVPEEVSFDIDVKTVPVKITEKGTVHEFVLHELSGEQRDQYLNFTGRKMKFEKGDQAGLKDFDNIASFTVSLSLRDKEGQAVPMVRINRWPARVVEGLEKIVKRISGLDKKARDVAKND